MLNMCAGGETLLGTQTIPIIEQLLLEGHYVMIVTNGLLTEKLVEITRFDSLLLERLFFKFSFHFLELKRVNKTEIFFDNIELVRAAGCSYTVEITPNDELEPHIEEVKRVCMDKLKVLCHVTIPRDVTSREIKLLSKRPLDEFYDIWRSFDSSLLDFKKEIFYVKRKEYCFAGAWTYLLNLATGDIRQCYSGSLSSNIYEDMDKPVNEIPIGHDCELAHCYNGHAFLTLGAIPELNTPTYASLRNRVNVDGVQWINERMASFLSQKLLITPEVITK